MKNAFILMAGSLFLIFASCTHEREKKKATSSSEQFEINGTIAEMDSGYVLISHAEPEGDTMITDTIPVHNNTFIYTGSQNVPAFYSLRIKGSRQAPARFFVENAKITFSAMKDSLQAANVSGSSSEDMYQNYLRHLEPVRTKMDQWEDQYTKANKSRNEQLVSSLEKTYDSLSEQKKEVISNFVKSYPKSIISAWAVSRNFRFNPDPQKLKPLYEALDTSVQSTVYGKEIKQTLDIAEKLQTGNTAPDFTQTNISGDPLSLSDLRGKYVLIDFWASWCGPCRRENPNVVKAYSQYKNDGFTILGVSLDENKEDWKKAVKKDHLNWHQVSDLKGWKNAVAREYGIYAIPSNILIGPKGKIIAKDLRREKLQNTLAAIFKK